MNECEEIIGRKTDVYLAVTFLPKHVNYVELDENSYRRQRLTPVETLSILFPSAQSVDLLVRTYPSLSCPTFHVFSGKAIFGCFPPFLASTEGKLFDVDALCTNVCVCERSTL